VSDQGPLRYRILRDGVPVLDWSHAGIVVDGVDLASSGSTAFTMSATDEDYLTRGVHTTAHNRSTNASYRFDRFTFETRVFNDGVGFRFVVPGSGSRTPDETTTFVLPAGSTTWTHDLHMHYEAVNVKRPIEDVPAGVRVELHRLEIRPDDSFERVHDTAGPQPLDRIGPCALIPQADGVVVTVRKTEPHEQSAGRLGTERVDELFPQQTHGDGAQNDDSLLVESNDAFVRSEIEQLGELQTTVIHPSTILLRTDAVQCQCAFSHAPMPMASAAG